MTDLTPEFSRLVSIARIPPHGTEESLTAKPAEREALAQRFDLISINSLTAQLEIQPGGKQSINVTGKMQADVMQSCVVTLEPVAAHLEIDIATHFIPAENHQEGAGPPYTDESDEEFEVFSGGKIDIGEMVAQYLGINLDPYPRKAGAALPPVEIEVKIDKPQPFAELKSMIKTQKNGDKTKN